MKKYEGPNVTVRRASVSSKSDERRTIVTMAPKKLFVLPFEIIGEDNEIYFKRLGEVVGNHSHKWWEVFWVKARENMAIDHTQPVLRLVWISHAGRRRSQSIYVGDIIIIKPGTPHAFEVIGEPGTFFLGVLMDMAFYPSGVTPYEPKLIKT